jgi:predicted component of type VI protein secretion system
MMLTLIITNHKYQATNFEAHKVFAEDGGRIGRAEDNDWVLPDPENYISSYHAIISYQEDAYYITDISLNGLVKNGQPVVRNKAAPLDDGDHLIIGDYEIAVRVESRDELLPPPDSLLAAFLQGAGLHESEISEINEAEIMQLAGQLLRESVQGIRDLLKIREDLIFHFRVERETRFGPENNNPLKFALNTEEALKKLLRKQAMPGYLAPRQAMKEALQDLRGHEMAIVVGIKAALKEIFKRFNPEVFEQRWVEMSLLDTFIPIYHKARCWSLFKIRFKELVQEAEDDFDEFFVRAFANAYEEQIRQHKLDKAKWRL